MEEQISSVGSTQEAHVLYVDPGPRIELGVEIGVQGQVNSYVRYASLRFNYNGDSDKIFLTREEIGSMTTQQIIEELFARARASVRAYLDATYPV